VKKGEKLLPKLAKGAVRSENFILTETVECGLRVGDFGEVYFGCTGSV